MRRVMVIGSSGAGKTTLGRSLSKQLGVAHLELDSVFHQAGWQELPTDEFHERVLAFIDEAGDGWVIDGNYTGKGVQALLVERADTIVWLDLPRWRIMTRLVPRTVKRAATGQELWNGNREHWRNLVSRNPEESVIRWSWTHHAMIRERYEKRATNGEWGHLDVIRVRSARELDRLTADPTWRPT